MKWVLYGSKVGCLLSQIFFLLFQTKNFKYDSQVNVFPFLLNQIWKKEKQIEFHFYLKLKKNIVILLFKRAVTCTYIIIYVTAFNTWKIWKKKKEIYLFQRKLSPLSKGNCSLVIIHVHVCALPHLCPLGEDFVLEHIGGHRPQVCYLTLQVVSVSCCLIWTYFIE